MLFPEEHICCLFLHINGLVGKAFMYFLVGITTMPPSRLSQKESLQDSIIL